MVRLMFLALLAAACDADTEEASVGGLPFPHPTSPARPDGCPASGPCLEAAQSPVLVQRGDAPARLVLRGWGLGEGGEVEVGGVTAEVLEWSEARVVVLLPGADVTDDGALQLSTAGGSASLDFVVAPRISELVGAFAPGVELELRGDGFGANAGRVVFSLPETVTHGDAVVGEVRAWGPDAIRVVAPVSRRGPLEIRVGRRVEHGGRDLGELRGAPFRATAGPTITRVDCRITRRERCRLEGAGWGTGYSVAVNGRPVTEARLDEDAALFDLPTGLPPGRLSIVLTTVEGQSTEPAEGALYAWHRYRAGAGFSFEGAPGTAFADDGGLPWVVAHFGSSAGLLPHGGAQVGLATCGFPRASFGPELSAVFAAQLDASRYLMAGPASDVERDYAAGFALRTCRARVGPEQPAELVGEFTLPEGAKGRVAGLAPMAAETLVLVRATDGPRSHLVRADLETGAFERAAVSDGAGDLAAAGERAFFVSSGGDTVDVFEVIDGAFVPVESPGAAPDGPRLFEPIPETGALRVLVTSGAGHTLRSLEDGGWRNLYALPPELGRPLAILADPAGDLVLAAGVEVDGHTPLHAFRRGGEGWTRLFEDLARSETCRMSVGRAALLRAEGRPLAIFEMGSPGCDEGVGSLYGPDALWFAELLE